MGIRRVNRGKNHSYTINNEKAMGVTTALSEGLPKPGLMHWSARVVAQAVYDMDSAELDSLRRGNRDTTVAFLKQMPFKQRAEAAVRGTNVHRLAEKLVHGEVVEVPDALVGYVESAAKFMDEWEIRPLLVERTVASYKYSYAGTFDLIAEVPDGRRILFDYKTGASGIWADTALQLAAYAYADSYLAEGGVEIPMSEVGITDAKAVWVRADDYEVIPLKLDDEVFKAFLAVLSVARAREEMGSWKGEKAEQPTDFADGVRLVPPYLIGGIK
jgi:hypothetical protein